jgi:hypothetical protein
MTFGAVLRGAMSVCNMRLLALQSARIIAGEAAAGESVGMSLIENAR